ncbi:sulfatase-like hydrolase/transferase [Flavilitoribacter nigricans]|uniref:Sulfatase n=1 Tax=Flavilitoribacter nigricans (strain ATCC 23147 / DSM 23189 / NBRC 102662 / NCIMB 1420 / SS-2) TaxID=1122177 RepID=A0A2D0N2U8_FLAN2|nr:sulfatase-like hydrolase/transferase [Flavilitoribacter nigricans]PHN02825.1 sulfatase [Flavilitoribacter nigricans DSM 23189 = NBRC 102662]
MRSTTFNSSLLVFLFSLILFSFSCRQVPREEEAVSGDAADWEELISGRPNILWLVTEDMSAYIAPFGDSTIETPNLSRLAAEGIVYPHLYSPSGVCAPSRAAIATGMYPSSIGANHMRTGSYTEVTGLPAYEAVPPSEVHMMSEYLRKAGYYCSNNSKKDYQFNDPVTAWDESGNFAHWRNREDGQPFFSIFNFTVTHESGLFEPYGYRKNEFRHYQSGDTSFVAGAWNEKVSAAETDPHVSKDLDFSIPPYLPQTDSVRRDMWKVYNNIAEMDAQLGAILDQLEADGLLDSTIIFFYADHGGPLPRQKRLIYDSGLNSPMIIRFPGKWRAGSRDEQLLSFIDFAPTVMSLVGIEPPAYLQGQAFLGEYQAAEPRQYIHAAADRFDGFTDAIRAVRGPRFKYIRNYRPEQGYYLPVVYREQIPTMRELLRMRDAGTLNEYQAQWFRETKPREELFDCENDPHELHNLAEDPEYADKLAELSAEMDRWLAAIGDQPNLPEAELVDQLWDGSKTQPETADPEVTISDDQVTISSATPGASIGYKVIGAGESAPKSWSVYAGPFTVAAGSELWVQAHRIGYVPSETIVREVE